MDTPKKPCFKMLFEELTYVCFPVLHLGKTRVSNPGANSGQLQGDPANTHTHALRRTDTDTALQNELWYQIAISRLGLPKMI